MFLNAGSCDVCVHPCSTCNSSAYCLSCVFGYYISSAGTCTNCPSACLTCTSATLCTSCDVGYYLDSGTNACLFCHDTFGDSCR